MTEEIIIDGVNVAGCEYISDIDCSCIFVKNYYGTTTKPRCSQVKNCHYKQLKRAEIEIEKLKSVDGSVHPDSAYYKIIRLEQENKELLEARNHFMAINLKYYNALEEIRILATKNVSIENFVKIQNRINEVLQ